MANAQLSRDAAKLFTEYKVPLDVGFEWAIEITSADTINDLSPELQSFLVEPYFINPKPVAKHMSGKHDQSTHAGNRASAESPEFSDNEKESIATYSGLAALQINHKLRGLPTKGQRRTVWDLSDEQIETATKNLDSAIAKSKLTQKMTLEREMPINAIQGRWFGKMDGKTIADKGFLSLRNTQGNIPARNGFVKMIVTAPAGTTALDLSFINPNAMSEIIFPRGTKIKITSVRGQASDVVVRGEIVE